MRGAQMAADGNILKISSSIPGKRFVKSFATAWLTGTSRDDQTTSFPSFFAAA